MRLFLILFAFSMVLVSSMFDGPGRGIANAAEGCTGDDCPPPAQESGRNCQKSEPTTS